MSQFSEYTIVDSIWARSFTNGKSFKNRFNLNINFSYFEKVESEKCNIFSWEYATCYWLIKEYKKTAKKMHVAYFLSKNLFCKKTFRPKNRLNLE